MSYLNKGFYRNLGTSYIELLAITILILILITVVINRIWPMRVAAERVGMEHMLGSLHSALGIAAITRASRGGVAKIAELNNSNPMLLFDDPPPNYIGELDDPKPETINGYSWYFDRRNNTLVYRVANDEYFVTSLTGPARARFQLKLHYYDKNGNNQYDPETDTLGALRLESLEPYYWRVGADGAENKI